MRVNRRRFLQVAGASGASAIAGCVTDPINSRGTDAPPSIDRIAADPLAVPDPIDRTQSKHHDITLTTQEVRSEVEPGVTFDYMTYEGQVPGPMIRIRQGDTVHLTLENPSTNTEHHSIDLHAVYGPGGGAEVTHLHDPGSEASFSFRAEYPGAFVYHCAVEDMDEHVSAGMFGMIVVEPPDGLPPVDKELYLGQHEIYTTRRIGSKGHHPFDSEDMLDEEATYVLFNGEKYAFTEESYAYGPLPVTRGERIRVFLANGGPNYLSSFHPIGNVWSAAYPNGALADQPSTYVQTVPVPPGSCLVGELETPVPGPIALVDHSLTRATERGARAVIDVFGDANPDVYDPEANESDGHDHQHHLSDDRQGYGNPEA